jgi:gamma-glutamyl:cysteine ligase YbdK (ATP-grasp superfamily)
LHNGVIWRWNRPLVGFDEDRTPHIRIEHRILPAGPTINDMMANAAFFYGLTQGLMEQISSQGKMPFTTAKDNFYAAARQGLNATIEWDGETYTGEQLQQLIVEKLLPMAAQGLQNLGIADDSIKHTLDVIKERTISGQTGAVWQVEHLKHVGGDLQKLTADYQQLQQVGNPVHSWTHN